jgi:hypothetical protein
VGASKWSQRSCQTCILHVRANSHQVFIGCTKQLFHINICWFNDDFFSSSHVLVKVNTLVHTYLRLTLTNRYQWHGSNVI